MAEGARLEIVCRVYSSAEGSNPSLSAIPEDRLRSRLRLRRERNECENKCESVDAEMRETKRTRQTKVTQRAREMTSDSMTLSKVKVEAE